jgi:hypothetical protein
MPVQYKHWNAFQFCDNLIFHCLPNTLKFSIHKMSSKQQQKCKKFNFLLKNRKWVSNHPRIYVIALFSLYMGYDSLAAYLYWLFTYQSPHYTLGTHSTSKWTWTVYSNVKIHIKSMALYTQAWTLTCSSNNYTITQTWLVHFYAQNIQYWFYIPSSPYTFLA